MKKIQLLGELGKKFGKSFKMDVKNPAEAVRALCVNFPEFRKELR
jgi:predicted phage tail protein